MAARIEAIRGYLHAASTWALHQMLIALASKLTMAGSAADLRDPLRAVVYQRAAIGEGLTHGHDARRGNGHEHARRALAARRGARVQRQADLPKRKPNLKKLWPQVWALVAPRKGLLLRGHGLMAVNRVAGLVLPYTSKPLLDKVLSPTNRACLSCCRSIIALVFSAMVVQAHYLVLAHAIALKGGSAADCRDAAPGAEARGLLSVAYYDENRTGTLVARIMSDVEGVRNLVGTGLVEFVGGLLTAVLAFLYLLHRSVTVTLTVFSVVGAFVFVLQYAFKNDSAHLPRAGQDQRRSYWAADGIAGRRARDQGLSRRRARGRRFRAGVERLLANVMKSLTMTSVLSVRIHDGAGAGFGAGDVAGRPSAC